MNIPVIRQSPSLVALILSKSPEQAGANTVANTTLSETVALLIDSWSRMTPRQKAWLSTWLQAGMGNWE